MASEPRARKGELPGSEQEGLPSLPFLPGFPLEGAQVCVCRGWGVYTSQVFSEEGHLKLFSNCTIKIGNIIGTGFYFTINKKLNYFLI